MLVPYCFLYPLLLIDMPCLYLVKLTGERQRRKKSTVYKYQKPNFPREIQASKLDKSSATNCAPPGRRQKKFPWEVLAALEEYYLVVWISHGQFGFQYEKKQLSSPAHIRQWRPFGLCAGPFDVE